MTSLLSKALEYREKASVIPVGKDKKPLISWKEFQSRIATEEEVNKWWTDHPNANIGIVTGKISNLAVVDVEKGGDISKFPETDMIRTGGDGWHLYYSYVEGVENKTRVFPLTDIRGEGGYVVAPPSIHASGKPYTIEKHVGKKPFPVHLFGLKEKTDWKEIKTGVPEGSRNDTMAKFIGKYMNAIKPEEWESYLWPFVIWQNQKNTPPLDERELRSIWVSIGKRAINNPREINQPPVIDDEEVDVLPMAEVAAAYASQQSETFKLGISEFDDVMEGGFMDGDLVIVTGQTGEGKTTWCQSLTYEMAKNKVPTTWFSYEVLIKSLWEHFVKMGVKNDMPSFAPFKMVSGNTTWVEKMMLKSIEKYNTKVFFIDHLGFLSKNLTSPQEANNMSAYIGSICRQLKSFAVQQQVVVVLLAHVKKVNDRDISTDDLAHSVGIAQEADFVFVVKRSKDYQTNDESTDSAVRMIKNRRTGARPWVTMEFKNNRLQKHDF